MAAQNINDIFEDCVNRLASGQSIADCLHVYPTHANRLRPLLETRERVRALQISQTELLEDQAIIWQQIEQQLPIRLAQSRRYRPPYRFLIIILLLLLLTVTWFLFSHSNLLPDEKNIMVPLDEIHTVTATETFTATATWTATVTASMTGSWTPTTTPTSTNTPTLTVTTTSSPTNTLTMPPATSTSTHTPTATITLRPSTTPLPSPTFVPGCGAPLTADDAINRVLEVYPNTTVTSVKQVIKFGGTLVWEVQTSHRIELTIDVGCGHILTIVQNGDNGLSDETEVTDTPTTETITTNNDDALPTESSVNVNDNNDSDNDNSDNGSNDNNDDNSGMGSDDDTEDDDTEDDDNSGMG